MLQDSESDSSSLTCRMAPEYRNGLRYEMPSSQAGIAADTLVKKNTQRAEMREMAQDSEMETGKKMREKIAGERGDGKMCTRVNSQVLQA